MKLASCDPGLSGGLTINDVPYDMPIKLIETKPAVMVLKKDSKGNKQYYKSGDKKGEPIRIVKTPAKHSKELDTKQIYALLKDCDTLVIENIGRTIGNSAKSSTTTATNFGKILACAELLDLNIHIVSPNKWKADLNLPSEKLPTVELAEKVSGLSFRTPKGRLLDGQADSYMIGIFYRKFILKEDIKIGSQDEN